MIKKLLHLFVLSLLDKSFGIPVTNTTSCFVGVIHNGSLESSFDDVRSFSLSQMYNRYSQNQWIFFSLQNLSLRIRTERNLLEETNITISTGYLRFVNKLQQEYCVIFLLLTYSLKDTVRGIRRSGFGTAEDALFLIPVPSLIETSSKLLYSFKHELISNNARVRTFTTNVLFYVPLNYLNQRKPLFGLFCYACSRHGDPVIPIVAMDYDAILLASQTINGNLKKNTITVNNPYTLEHDTKCLQILNPFATKETFDSLNPCSQWQTGWSAYGHAINATFVSGRHKLTETESLYGKWLTKLTVSMGSLNMLSQQFVFDRGLTMAIMSREQRLFVCIYSKSLAVFDSSLKRLIPLDILACIIICVGCHVAMFSGFKNALKLFWLFLGLTSKISKRARKTAWLTVALAGTIGISWQACASADALAFTSLPSEKKLMVEMKYKIWIPMTWVLYWKSVVGTVIFERYTHGLNEKIYHYMEKYPKAQPWDLTETSYTIASHKLAFWNIQNWGLMDRIWNRPMLLNNSVVCQAVSFDRNETTYYYARIEISGVSAKAKKLARRWIEVGLALTDKIYDRTFTELFGTGITPVHGFSKPMPLAFSGVIGTCVIVTFCTELLLFVTWLFRYYGKHWLGYINWHWNICAWHLNAWKRGFETRLRYSQNYLCLLKGFLYVMTGRLKFIY